MDLQEKKNLIQENDYKLLRNLRRKVKRVWHKQDTRGGGGPQARPAAMLFVFSVTETARGGPSRGERAFLMIMENPESILEELESECGDYCVL